MNLLGKIHPSLHIASYGLLVFRCYTWLQENSALKPDYCKKRKNYRRKRNGRIDYAEKGSGKRQCSEDLPGTLPPDKKSRLFPQDMAPCANGNTLSLLVHLPGLLSPLLFVILSPGEGEELLVDPLSLLQVSVQVDLGGLDGSVSQVLLDNPQVL